jgi:AcrR family transcriptional regulator
VTEVPVRRWAKTDATQQRILDAATEVFGEKGFTAATIADVVARSGASIGSIYHHFGGKKELYLAIFERMVANIEQRTDGAPAGRSGTAGGGGPQAFDTQARAYLEAMWANRRAVMVLASGDAPAGFDRIRRSSMLSSFRRWMAVLDLDASPRGQLLSRFLVAMMAESALMVAMCEKTTDAQPIIDATIEWINRLTTER